MNNLDDTDPVDEPRAFRQQSFPKRVVVMSGGSAMHFLQAFVLFLLVFTVVGVPGDTDLAQKLGGPAPRWGVVEVVDDSAAKAAGIRVGDEVLSIDGREVEDPGALRPLVVGRGGDTVPIVVRRDGAERTVQVTIGTNPDSPGDGFLGVGTGLLDTEALSEVTTGPVDGVIEAASTTGTFMWETTKGLGTFATGGLGDLARNVVGDDGDEGPGVVGSGSGSGAGRQADTEEGRAISIAGVARIGANAAENSMAELFLLLAVVNISIGIINLVPLLPFDGGHIAIAVYERIRSRKGRRYMADVSRLLPLTYAVVLLLGFIMVSTIYLDFVDPIGLG